MSIFNKKQEVQPMIMDIPQARSFSEEMNDVFNQRDTSGQVEAIKTLFDPKDIKMKSDISRQLNESAYLSKLLIFQDVFFSNNNNILNNYVKEQLFLRVSNDRQGRNETVNMARNTPQPEQRKSLFGGMFR